MLRKLIEFIWISEFLTPRGCLASYLDWPFFVSMCLLLLWEFVRCSKEIPHFVKGLLGLYTLPSTGPARFCASWKKIAGIPGYLERVGSLVLTQQNHVRAKLRRLGRANSSNEKNFRGCGGERIAMRHTEITPLHPSWAKLVKWLATASLIWWIAARRPRLNLISAFAHHRNRPRRAENQDWGP